MGWLMSIPHRFVAAFGWPGLAIAVGGGAFVVRLLKTSAKPYITAAVIALVSVAVWWFWPSRTAIPQEVPTSQADMKSMKEAMRRREYAVIIAKRRFRRSHHYVQRWR